MFLANMRYAQAVSVAPSAVARLPINRNAHRPNGLWALLLEEHMKESCICVLSDCQAAHC